MRNWTSIIIGLAICGTSSAAVSVRVLDLPASSDNGIYMSEDARVVVSGSRRLIDFVRVDLDTAQLGQPYTYSSWLFRPSGNGLVLPVFTYIQTSGFSWIYTDNPPTATLHVELEDECQDSPVSSSSSYLNFDGSIAAYSTIHIGDNLCGFQGSGGRSRAVIWDRDKGATRMIMPTEFPGVSPGVDASRARTYVTGITSDGGRVALNYAPQSINGAMGAIFTRSTEDFVFPFDVPGEFYAAWISAMSLDGTAVVGTVQIGPSSGTSTLKAALKVGDDPVVRMDLSPLAQGFNRAELYDVSNGGTVAVGMVSDTSLRYAAVWDSDGNMRLLNDILIPAHPSALCGWHFERITSVTPDGSTVVGSAKNHLNQTVMFMAKLWGDPLPPGPGLRTFGDTNGDNAVDGADLSALLSSFGSTVTPGTQGDLNCDGLVNAADLSVLLSNFGS